MGWRGLKGGGVDWSEVGGQSRHPNGYTLSGPRRRAGAVGGPDPGSKVAPSVRPNGVTFPEEMVVPGPKRMWNSLGLQVKRVTSETIPV